MKPTTTFGQLPMMTWDGLEMAQSHAIVRFTTVNTFDFIFKIGPFYFCGFLRFFLAFTDILL